jgi:hypothetical protein
MPRGSKPGERRGGRRPGSKNRRTLALEAAVRATVDGAKADELPAEFLRRVVQNEDLDLAVRIDAAKACASFFSPKLASVNATVQAKGQYWISDEPMTEEEWIAEFCKDEPDDAQTLALRSPHKLEVELRERIAELESEVVRLNEALTLPGDG